VARNNEAVATIIHAFDGLIERKHARVRQLVEFLLGTGQRAIFTFAERDAYFILFLSIKED
jgi:hypothetical protein